MVVRGIFSCLLVLITSLVIVSPVFAQNKVGINVAARHTPGFDEFPEAAQIVGPGGWVVIMASNANRLQKLIDENQAAWNTTNTVLRGHCPSDPLGPDDDVNKLFALSWAATLGSLDLKGKRIYFMPWNEPNMTRECGDSGDDSDPMNVDCAPHVEKYVQNLKGYLDDPQMGNIGSKVALLSPMLNQHHPNYDAFVNYLRPRFFGQFEGISMNLYDNETCGGPLCQDDPHFNAGKFEEILNRMSGNLPAFALETGLIASGGCESGVSDCPQFGEPGMSNFLRAVWDYSWRDSSRLKMFSPLSYNPETNEESWIYDSATATFMQQIRVDDSVAADRGFDPVVFEEWLIQALQKPVGEEGKIYKCPGLENSYAADPGMCNFCAAKRQTFEECGDPYPITREEDVDEVSKCKTAAMCFNKTGQICDDLISGNSSQSLPRRLLCRVIGSVPGMKLVCQIGDLSDWLQEEDLSQKMHLPAFELPGLSGITSGETAGVSTGSNLEVQGQSLPLSILNWIWDFILRHTDKTQGGWISTLKITQRNRADYNELSQVGLLGDQDRNNVLQAATDDSAAEVAQNKRQTINSFETNYRQELTPYSLLRKFGGAGLSPGGGGLVPAGPPVVGQCDELSSGYCSVENLSNYFNSESAARNAAQICNAESGGDPLSLNDRCDPYHQDNPDICADYGVSQEDAQRWFGTCTPFDPASPRYTQRTLDFSVGLFQINLLAHCADAFRSASIRCEVVNVDRLLQCIRRFEDPSNNIQFAADLSRQGENWCPWATAPVCGIQQCE